MGPVELPVAATAEVEVAGALLEELAPDVGSAELEGSAELLCEGVGLEAAAEDAEETADVVLAEVELIERASLLLVVCTLEPPVVCKLAPLEIPLIVFVEAPVSCVVGTLVEPEDM